MIPTDIAYGILSGLLSCLTPEALLLFPLLLAAIAANSRVTLVALAIGLGVSQVMMGSAGMVLSFDLSWLRKAAAIALLILGFVLTRRQMVNQFSVLTGGAGGMMGLSGQATEGASIRAFMLALLVGAIWIPRIAPTLGKASLLAANEQDAALALAVVFLAGVSAAIPWIVVARVIRLVLRPFAAGLLSGMGGKRLLGFALLILAIVVLTGEDRTLIHWVDTLTPAWARRLSVRF